MERYRELMKEMHANILVKSKDSSILNTSRREKISFAYCFTSILFHQDVAF